MNFLNPGILIALAAISIPILIHLLNLRKVRKMEFSTLMLLKEIQKSKMRRIKLKQLLLLLFRILAIASLVLAFAQPVYEGYAGSTDASNSSVIIFLDDSFSMTSRDSKGMYLQQAKNSVKKILELKKASNEIYFVPVSKLTMRNSKFLYNNAGEVLDSLERIKPSNVTSDLSRIAEFISNVFVKNNSPVKEAFVVSDFQKSDMNGELRPLEGIENVRLYLLKTGSRTANNLSVDSLKIVSKILQKDKSIKLSAYINDYSPYSVKNKIVNLVVEGELKGEKAIDINSFDKSKIEFSFMPSKSGSISGYLELVQSDFGEDEIESDNKVYFSLYIPEHFEIGILNESSPENTFVKLALESASFVLSDSSGSGNDLFRINNISSLDQNMFKNQVLFISGRNEFTDSESEMLKGFVSHGGGLFLFPGKDVRIDNYNSTLLSKLNTARIGGLNSDKSQNENLKLGKVDFQNPLLSEIFSNKNLNITSDQFDIQSPKIFSYYELLNNENSSDIISLTNGKPFLIESSLARGRVLMSCVPATTDFSDFPLKDIFVPIIVRSIYYLSNQFEYQSGYAVGKANITPVNGIENISAITLPDKKTIGGDLFPEITPESFVVIPYSDNFIQTGTYEMKDSSGKVIDFSLNYNSSESDMRPASREELLGFFEAGNFRNVTYVKDNEEITDVVRDSRNGINLWKYFLIAAILFALSEMILSRKIEKS